MLLDQPEVQTVITSIGRQRWSTDSNLGEMKVLLTDLQDRTKTTAEMLEETEVMLSSPDLELELEVSGGGGIPGGRGGWGPTGISISLIGPDTDVLMEFATRIEDRLTREPDFMTVSTGRNRPTPELHYILDRQRISRMDVNANQIASAFGTQARGTRAGFFREEGREIPIQVRNDRDRFQNRSDLFALDVLQVDDVRIPIMGVGDFQVAQGMNNITRRDREGFVDLNIGIRGEPAESMQKVQEILTNDVILPAGYRYDFDASTRQMDESQQQLGFAFLFSLLLTYMVMASVFENFKDPFIIMFTVPLAFFGSLIFLFITGTSLS
ncbi:MAG: efflux RND transporter permease subunit, partial [Balneolaceae bacterium]